MPRESWPGPTFAAPAAARLLRCAVALLAPIVLGGAAQAAELPDWVRAGGLSPRYPETTYLTGFAVAEGAGALEAARNGAAAALAARVGVSIEHRFRAEASESAGTSSYAVASLTRAAVDVRLANLRYETATEGPRSWAFAYKKIAEATLERIGLRDQAVSRSREALAGSQRAEAEKRESDALAQAYEARLWAQEAADQHAVLRALAAGAEVTAGSPADAPFDAAPLAAQAEDRVRALLKKPTSTLEEAVASLALQLGQQGVNGGRWTAAPLTYGTTGFSSELGRRVAQELERALAAQPRLEGPGAKSLGDLALRGSYVVTSGLLRLLLVARAAKDGRAVAAAEASLPRAALPADLSVLPQNFAQALEEQRLLAAEELVPGALRVEAWTNRGRTGLVFAQREEVSLYLRVNQPAYVRLVYLLATGQKVLLEQAFFLDASKVNQAVELPDRFLVAAPFGVEQLYAVAFTERPEPLATVREVIDGEEYDVVTGGLDGLLRHRGLARKKGAAQAAEATVAFTTVAQ